MDKIGVLGEYDSIYGFSALGLDIYPVKGQEEIKETLRQLAEGGYGILLVTEAAAAQATEEIEQYRERVTPVILLIPGVTGNTGAGVEGVKKTVEQAVGSDILFGGESQ